MKPTLILDTEVYLNYFLLAFLNVETGNIRNFEMYPEVAYDETGKFDESAPAQALDILTIERIFKKYRVVSFNGINYDIPIISVALGGADCAKIKRVSDKIIVNNMKYWHLDINCIRCDHIDLFNVAPGMASLKIYGGRLHGERMQDLPYDPADIITPAMREPLREYCGNDLRNTLSLFEKLKPQIALRESMGLAHGIDLRSKSDAQIAEAVIRKGVETRLGLKLEKIEANPGDVFRYEPPSWVQFATPELQAVLDQVCAADFVIDSKGVVKDPFKGLTAKIGKGVYRMGIGGLHSSETCIAHLADTDHIIVDRDVTSYYPGIILNCGLQPRHMGNAFTEVYRGLVEQRIAAKKANDTVTADALKITINGSFGKFGSPYSILYSPTLLIQTTVTGQLALLMLIEQLELCDDIAVISANTDGVAIRCHKEQINTMNKMVMLWEKFTSFITEETQYLALYSRDVNNYIAVKTDGKLKLKGAYASAGLQKNPNNEICIGAVVRQLTENVPVADTIRNCRDITKFVTIRQVQGGAVKDGQYLGKAVRWYYSAGETGTINYKLNGNVVARSHGARPLMELPWEFPSDVDYEWYIREAFSMMFDLGAM